MSLLLYYNAPAGGGSAPTITSPATVDLLENSPLTHTLTGTGVDSWSIVGGADQAHFELSLADLRWASNGTKDFESPNDANADNSYVVIIRATNSNGTTDQTVTVTITNVLYEVLEGQPWTKTMNFGLAPYVITGGADALFFSLDASNKLTLPAQDYELPGDADTNNIYEVEVTDDFFAVQGFSVQVVKVVEGGARKSYTYTFLIT